AWAQGCGRGRHDSGDCRARLGGRECAGAVRGDHRGGADHADADCGALGGCGAGPDPLKIRSRPPGAVEPGAMEQRLRMLKGKIAIVTGSTSGIGLGIATALAAQGCNLMLNGFGDAAEIEKLRKGLADQHGVKASYSGADMSKPADIRALVADT